MKGYIQDIINLYESNILKDYITIPYINACQNTYGKHSFGMDDEEIPADNPGNYITPDYVVDYFKLEELLIEHGSKIINVLYIREDYGTYHYRSLHGQALLEVELSVDTDKSQLEYDILQLNEYELNNFKELTGSKYGEITRIERPFEGWYNIEETWKDFMKGVKLQPITGSSKDFWDKQILMAHAQQKAWDKRTYDGD